MTLADAIGAIYLQVDAPDWAAANLDALVDVLRDLSWLPEGPVQVTIPEISEPVAGQLRTVLWQIVAETARGPRPVIVAA
jgi:barstar (barnase inhibitor)